MLDPAAQTTDSLSTVTIEHHATGWDAIVRQQAAAIQQLQTEVKALRGVIAKRAMDEFLDRRYPVGITFTLNGVTHHVFVYDDEDGLIHTIEV